MSRIKISNKGLETVRGNGGVEHVDSNGRGYTTVVKSAILSSGITTNATLGTGIIIPADAAVEYISIKLLTEYENGATGDRTSVKIEGITFSGQGYGLLAASQIEAHGGTTTDLLEARIFNLAPIDDDATNDTTSLQAVISSASASELTVDMQITGGSTDDDGSGDETQATYSVVVQYIMPKF